MIRLAFGRNSTLLLKQTKKILNHTKNQQFSFSTTTQKTNETLNPNDREYFYYVNQEGHVYLTDEKISRKPFGPVFYRDPKFLRQMFNLIKQNQTNKYSKLFPFIWICMKERNYVACEDTPIVFSSLNQEDNKIFYGPNLFVSFQPEEVSISSDGRFYRKYGGY